MRMTRSIAQQSFDALLRSQIVWMFITIFAVLVSVSAYLGWSATHTVQSIYLDAVQYFESLNQEPPTNPVLKTSPLALMRNMVTYISLIGALAAIIVGHQLVAHDKKSGTIPLLFTHPISAKQYAFGKFWALGKMLFAMSLIVTIFGGVLLLVLPAVQIDAPQWMQFIGFVVLSWVYMSIFGTLALGFAARVDSQSSALLMPILFLLIATFILPEVTGNIHPTAAINPISALAATPDSGFFRISSSLIGMLSLEEAYLYQSAKLLDFLPDALAYHSPIPPIFTLMSGLAGSIVCAYLFIQKMLKTTGDFNV